MAGSLRLGLAATALALATALLPAPAPAADDGVAVADWTLETARGGTVSFHEALAEGPVVVSFWATWCLPCLKELPHLDALAARHAGRVTYLAVNTDDTKAVAKVAPYLEAAGLEHLTVPLDTGGLVQQQMQVGGIMPFVAVYDRRGREVYRHVGYKEGDELALAAAVDALLDAGPEAAASVPRRPAWAEAVTATDRFEYSYSTRTQREIFENWLDVSYQLGGFRTGLMLDSRAPSEEGDRSNEIAHRFFEFATGDVQVRAGHFYGVFGRGLVFAAYEDRVVRVDTRLDGLKATLRRGGLTATAFSGTPAARELDIRAADAEQALPAGLRLGATGMTWRPDPWTGDDGDVRREWVAAVRARQKLGSADWYAEYGWKKGWDFDPNDDGADLGKAFYANLNLYRGPVSVSWEHSDYERFTVVPRADGTNPLNRPPSLTRDFTWTLLNRAPHPMDQDDERGDNLDVVYGGDGWQMLGTLARLERQDGTPVYELAYASGQIDRIGDLRVRGGFGYQDKEGLRQTAMLEATWFATPRRSLTLQAEHQHVRPDGRPGVDPGAYDEDWFKLEYEAAPTWAFAAILEVNNKYAEQMAPDEQEGPFPAGQVTYTLARGGNLNLWFGERQAGYLCAGGVCKYEPAFAGVEFFGVFRY